MRDMIYEKRIKNILLDMRKQCKENFDCECCPYQEIFCPYMAYLWNDEKIENMADRMYELLNREE